MKIKEMPEIILPQFQNMVNKDENGRLANNVKKYKISKQFLINVAEINNKIIFIQLTTKLPCSIIHQKENIL